MIWAWAHQKRGHLDQDPRLVRSVAGLHVPAGLPVPPAALVALVVDPAHLVLRGQVAGVGLALLPVIENIGRKEAEKAPARILVAVPDPTQEATPEAVPDHTARAWEEDIHLLTEDITDLLLDTGHVAGPVHFVEDAIQEAVLHHIAEDSMALQGVPTLLHSEVGEAVLEAILVAGHHCA